MSWWVSVKKSDWTILNISDRLTRSIIGLYWLGWRWGVMMVLHQRQSLSISKRHRQTLSRGQNLTCRSWLKTKLLHFIHFNSVYVIIQIKDMSLQKGCCYDAIRARRSATDWNEWRSLSSREPSRRVNTKRLEGSQHSVHLLLLQPLSHILKLRKSLAHFWFRTIEKEPCRLFVFQYVTWKHLTTDGV